MIDTEDKLYRSLKERFPYAHWQRIEGSGVPDVNVALREQEFWLELKIGLLRMKKGELFLRFKKDLTKFQAAWLAKRWAYTQNSLICVHIVGAFDRPSETVVIRGRDAGLFIGNVLVRFEDFSKLAVMNIAELLRNARYGI